MYKRFLLAVLAALTIAAVVLSRPVFPARAQEQPESPLIVPAGGEQLIQLYLPAITKAPPFDFGDSISWAGVPYLSDLIVQFNSITSGSTPCDLIVMSWYDESLHDWTPMAADVSQETRFSDHSEAKIDFLYWWGRSIAGEGGTDPNRYEMACVDLGGD